MNLLIIFVLLFTYVHSTQIFNPESRCTYSRKSIGEQSSAVGSFNFMENLENEIWKSINDYYQVSNLGRIRSVDRMVKYKNGSTRFWKGMNIIPTNNGTGYFSVFINDSSFLKRKRIYVHILVARAFIPNPTNLPEVNHIHGVKSDNRASELEWCTRLYNIHDYIKNGRAKYPPKKPVYQIDFDGTIIKRWDSSPMAAKGFKCTDELIQQAASPNNKNCFSAKNFIWVYEQDYPNSEKYKICLDRFSEGFKKGMKDSLKASILLFLQENRHKYKTLNGVIEKASEKYFVCDRTINVILESNPDIKHKLIQKNTLAYE